MYVLTAKKRKKKRVFYTHIHTLPGALSVKPELNSQQVETRAKASAATV